MLLRSDPAPPRPGPLINVMKGFCRLTKIFQAFLILEGILELWLGKKSFVLEMASCWQICCSANGAFDDNFQIKYFSHDLCLSNRKILCPQKALNNKKGINLLSYNSYFAVLNPGSFVAWRAPSNTVSFSLPKLEVLVLMSLGFYQHLQYCLVMTVF